MLKPNASAPSQPLPAPVLGMILKGYPRISETFISNEILQLENQGFRLHLFSMRQPREKFNHRSVDRIRATVDYLPERLLTGLGKLLPPNFQLAFSQPQLYRQALSLAGRRWTRTHKMATFKHLLQAGYIVARLMPKVPLCHLHAHFAHSPTSVAMFTSLLCGCPFSFTAHAKDIYTSDQRQLVEKMAAAKFVITCTEYNRRFLKRLASTCATPIHRLYHGIDVGLFAASVDNTQSPPKAPFKLLTVARITPKKGLPTVYQALKRLKDAGIAFAHVLIGDGDQRRHIEKLIAQLGLQSETRCLGTQSHDTVLQYYRWADLFVLGCEVAKNGDRDGIPNVFLESMAMGVPVVATPISAIPEVIIHGRTGLAVPPRDPQAMADAILQLLTNATLRQGIIQAGQDLVADQFDNQVLSSQLADIYRQAGIGP